MRFIDAAQDRWHMAIGEGALPPCEHLLLTLVQWHAVREKWPADLNTGMIVPNDTDIETLATDLPKLPLLALQFPKWVDGRAYSQARLLRSRYRFTGEIRAIGDVVADMLPLLARTGFDAVQLRADQDIEVARRTLGHFSNHYQGDVRQPRPWFARSGAAA